MHNDLKLVLLNNFKVSDNIIIRIISGHLVTCKFCRCSRTSTVITRGHFGNYMNTTKVKLIRNHANYFVRHNITSFLWVCVKSVLLWWEFGATLWWCVAEFSFHERHLLEVHIALQFIPTMFSSHFLLFHHSFNICSSQEPSIFITSSYLYLYYFSFQFSSPFSMFFLFYFVFFSSGLVARASSFLKRGSEWQPAMSGNPPPTPWGPRALSGPSVGPQWAPGPSVGPQWAPGLYPLCRWQEVRENVTLGMGGNSTLFLLTFINNQAHNLVCCDHSVEERGPCWHGELNLLTNNVFKYCQHSVSPNGLWLWSSSPHAHVSINYS